MGFRSNQDVPSTSKPSVCARRVEGKPCGKPAHNSISGKADVFGKLINVKFMVCDEHVQILQEGLIKGLKVDD
jgi:hypothetical protein